MDEYPYELIKEMDNCIGELKNNSDALMEAWKRASKLLKEIVNGTAIPEDVKAASKAILESFDARAKSQFQQDDDGA